MMKYFNINHLSLYKNIFLISIVFCSQNLVAQNISEAWWFIFVKESFFSENKSYTKELFSAVKNNDIPRALSALDKGAVINARDEKGRTPLHWAVYKEYFQMAEFLLEHGADPNAVNRRHRTPLHWAVLKPDEKWTDLLLKYDANPNIQDKQSRTPLLWIALKPDKSIERLTLTQRTQNSSSETSSLSPLYWEQSDLKKMQLLLHYKADPHLTDLYNRTPLHISAIHDRLSAVQLLASHGAKVNSKDYAEETPLHSISKKTENGAHTLAIAEFLLENGADPNALGLSLASPVHLAELHKNTELKELLMEFGGRPKRHNACMRLLKKLKQ